MRDPAEVAVAETHDECTIRQRVYRVADETQRFAALRGLLLQHRPRSSVVFCNTRREAQALADALAEAGFSALALHGDLEQRDRDRILVLFANGSVSILVATDVAARGLDIAALDAVFNYQIARDLEVHVHRVGRTGRAGGSGIACTLVSESEAYRLERLNEFLGEPLEEAPLPPRSVLTREPFLPEMATLQLDGGKKQKVRPGDILGALTGEGASRSPGGQDQGAGAQRLRGGAARGRQGGACPARHGQAQGALVSRPTRQPLMAALTSRRIGEGT